MNSTQKRVYEFLLKFIERRRYAPTYREIATGLGYHSISAIGSHLRALRGDGWIDFEDDKARTIVILEVDDAD